MQACMPIAGDNATKRDKCKYDDTLRQQLVLLSGKQSVSNVDMEQYRKKAIKGEALKLADAGRKSQAKPEETYREIKSMMKLVFGKKNVSDDDVTRTLATAATESVAEDLLLCNERANTKIEKDGCVKKAKASYAA